MRLFVLLFLLTTFLSGASFDDEWPLYVYGDSSYYKLILDGIAMIVQNDDFMDPALLFVALSSTLFVARGFYTQNISDVAWNVAAGIGFMTMLMYPNSTVHVLDVRTLHGYVQTDLNSSNPGYAGYTKTDNIPFYIAASASFATSIKYHIIDVATDALTPIDVVGGSFRNSGFATPMTLAEDMITTSSFKHSKDDQYKVPIFGQALSHYTEKCIIENALYTNQKKIHGIRDPKMNQLEAMKPSNFDNFDVIRIVDLEGQDKTCTQFWNENISSKITEVKNEMIANLENKNPDIPISPMAKSVTFVAGLESDTTEAFADMQEAMVNIATTSVIMNAFSKAGTGLSGIDLSNEMTAQQSLFANMTDSTGQFKWMIRVVPVLEFLIFGILLFLAIPMAFVAGISGAQRGGKMLMNYTFGLIAFSFVDVALAVVQAISLFYYKNKMADTVIALGGHPYTASGITPYLQEMAYMSGMMGLAAVIVVPITVGVVFKGETAAAMGAYNSVMGKYKGDQGGQNALDSSKRAAAIHTSQAQQEQQAMEDAARRELAGGYSITSVPKGILASQYLDQISAEAAALSGAGGTRRMVDSEYGGDYQKFAQHRARAGMGTGMQKLGSEIGSGNGVMDSISANPSSMSNFMHQAGTAAASGFMAQAAMGKFSKDNKDYDRDAQVKAAQVMANDGLVKSVQTAKGLVDSMAFDKDGNIGNSKQFGLYEDGISTQSRIQANTTMGVGLWSQTKSEAEMKNAMSDIQRVGAMGVAGEVAKGDAFQKGKYKGDLSKYESDMTDIEKSKSDSMFGQARAVRANYGVNGNIYSDNAEYAETSSQQSTDAKIEELDGVKKAIDFAIKQATGKAAHDKKEMERLDKENKDNGGYIGAMATKGGMSAVATMGSLQKPNLYTEENMGKFYNELRARGVSKDELSSLKNSDGSFKTGLDAATVMAQHAAGNVQGQHGVVFGDKSIGASFSKDGVRVGMVDDSTTRSTGHKFNLNTTNGLQQRAINYAKEQLGGSASESEILGRAQEIFEKAEENKSKGNPLEDVSIVTAAHQINAKHSKNNRFNLINDNSPLNFLEEGFDKSLDFVSEYGTSAMAAIGVNSVFGNPAGKLWNKVDPLSQFRKDKTNTLNGESNNSSDYKQTDKSGSKSEFHSDTPNSDTDSVSKNTKSGKSSISEQIEAQYKKEQVLSGDAKYNSDIDRLKEKHKRQLSLNPDNPNLASFQAMELAAMEDAHYQRIQSDKDSVLKNTKSGKSGFWNSTLESPVVKALGRGLGVLDTYMAGNEAIDQYQQGNNKLAFTNALEASTVAAATVAPNPLTIAAAGIATGTNMVFTAANYLSEHGNTEFTGPKALAGQHPVAPQHKGFTALPMGHNTLQQMQSDYTASVAHNAQQMSHIAPNQAHVGFTMQDADQNPVTFTTDKSSRNMMMNGYDTGMPAQQFSNMVQSPDAVNQFASAISQTSFSSVEAYNATNNILMDMNAQTQRANTQVKIRDNSRATQEGMRHKEFAESLLNKDKENLEEI